MFFVYITKEKNQIQVDIQVHLKQKEVWNKGL